MSGVSSGVGIFSGIDSKSIIDQLISIDSRPKNLLQRRLVQVQLQQTAFMDFNSKLSNLRNLLKDFRQDKIFRTMQATSSSESVIKATASNTAAPGTYQFVVDRLVSTQQMLSRGFADRDVSGLNAGTWSIESAQARLDRDVALADLKGGLGVQRGRILITDSGNRTATVDLSRSSTIGEVVEAINTNGTAEVSARIVDDKLIITDRAGGAIRIANTGSTSTATSLGIEGTATGSITSSPLVSLASGTLLSTLNDGNGVYITPTSTPNDFSMTITVGSGGGAQEVRVNLGDVWEIPSGQTVAQKTRSAVNSVGGALTRINEALQAAGLADVSASIAPDGQRLRLVDAQGRDLAVADRSDSQAAANLGLVGSTTGGTITGRRILSGMGTTLARSLNGGAGIAGDGTLNFTARDGTAFSVNVGTDWSLAQIAKAIEDASGTVSGASRLSVSVNSRGTGLSVRDNSGGAGNLFITGTNGNDTAASLGISTGAGGVASATVNGSNLQRQYLSKSTLVSSLNNGKGIGTGRFRITDGAGVATTIDIGNDTRTLGDLIDEINRSATGVRASINSTGDGLLIQDALVPPGASAIKIEDSTGSVARSLNLAGEATGTGASNRLNGSFEKTITFAATDNLTQVVSKINNANAGVVASILNDGSNTSPFRISFTAGATGSAGRFLIDTGGFDLGLSTQQRGDDARAFFGSSDPASSLLLSSSTNSLDNAIAGVRIDLVSANSAAQTITVGRDSSSIETKLDQFVSNFNGLISQINGQTSYDKDTKKAGSLLGDGTALGLRTAMFSAIQAGPQGFSTRYSRLTEIGFKIGTAGRLELNKDKLRQALAEDPNAVEALLFNRTQEATTPGQNGVTVTDPDAPPRFSELGVLAAFEELANRYVDSQRGVLTGKNRAFDTQIRSINTQISAFDARLSARRAILEQRFLRMEKSIGQLQAQQGSIASMNG